MPGLPTLPMIAKRRRSGMISRNNSSRLLTRANSCSDMPDIAARPREAVDELDAERVTYDREYDRDDRCRLLGRQRCQTSGASKDEIDVQPNELGGDLGHALGAALRPAILDGDGATLDPTEFVHPIQESGDPLALDASCTRAEHPYRWQPCRLLRARRNGPSCRAAEQRDELAPSDVTCHAPSLGGMPSQTILHRYSIIRVSCALTAIRSLRPSTSGRSRTSSKAFVCAIGRRDGAQARSATSVINRTDAVQDTRRFRPQPFAGGPRSPYR